MSFFGWGIDSYGRMCDGRSSRRWSRRSRRFCTRNSGPDRGGGCPEGTYGDRVSASVVTLAFPRVLESCAEQTSQSVSHCGHSDLPVWDLSSSGRLGRSGCGGGPRALCGLGVLSGNPWVYPSPELPRLPRGDPGPGPVRLKQGCDPCPGPHSRVLRPAGIQCPKGRQDRRNRTGLGRRGSVTPRRRRRLRPWTVVVVGASHYSFGLS